MLMIRLQRVGRTNDPSFRVVVTDSKNGPKSGKFLEIIGSHNPRTDATTIDAERVKHWMAHGAQTSDTLHNLLISQKIIEGKLDKHYSTVCLLDQPFVKTPEKTVKELLSHQIATIGENIQVRRFVRYQLGS